MIIRKYTVIEIILIFLLPFPFFVLYAFNSRQLSLKSYSWRSSCACIRLSSRCNRSSIMYLQNRQKRLFVCVFEWVRFAICSKLLLFLLLLKYRLEAKVTIFYGNHFLCCYRANFNNWKFIVIYLSVFSVEIEDKRRKGRKEKDKKREYTNEIKWKEKNKINLESELYDDINFISFFATWNKKCLNKTVMIIHYYRTKLL